MLRVNLWANHSFANHKFALLKCYALLNKNDFVIVCNSKPVIKYESAICHFNDPLPHSKSLRRYIYRLTNLP